MKRPSPVLLMSVGLFALICGVFFGTGEVTAQRQRRRAPARTQTPTSRVDYSRFLHSTKQHQAACVTCHKIPTSNWRRVREYPDIVDYPDHAACVSCHRRQFFSGAKPPICSGCHSRVSPKDDVRLAFRNPSRRSQFEVQFPHDKHQDVIAELLRQWPGREQPRIIRTSFQSTQSPAQGSTAHYFNCEICHGPRTTPAVTPVSTWTDGFIPDNQTLKSAPTSHASCFSCHWRAEQPINENCAGCHKLGTKQAMATPELPKRISMKFRHGREQHVMECAACHINITKSATVRGLKPDVPITACSECHNKAPNHLEISNELAAIDKKNDFVCVYCHTSNVGRLDPPTGHYLIAERPPLKRKEIK